MSGIIGDNLGRSGGLIKAVSTGGSHVHLVTNDFTSAVSSFEWGSSYITSTYDTYLILWQCRDADDGSGIDCRLSDDNGSSYATSNYTRCYFGISGSTSDARSFSATSGYMQMGQGTGNAADEYGFGSFYLCNPMSSTFHTGICGIMAGLTTSKDTSAYTVSTFHNNNDSTVLQHNAIAFSAGGFSANLESGIYSLYGVKRS
jgi:hypothetical protein